MAAKKPNRDGMRYPSIDKLLEKVDSKYKLVYISSKRAKIIESEQYVAIENPRCVKAVGQALEEILEDKVHCEFKK
jgi:DNA-directed RNA polymerase subunit omega